MANRRNDDPRRYGDQQRSEEEARLRRGPREDLRPITREEIRQNQRDFYRAQGSVRTRNRGDDYGPSERREGRDAYQTEGAFYEELREEHERPRRYGDRSRPSSLPYDTDQWGKSTYGLGAGASYETGGGSDFDRYGGDVGREGPERGRYGYGTRGVRGGDEGPDVRGQEAYWRREAVPWEDEREWRRQNWGRDMRGLREPAPPEAFEGRPRGRIERRDRDLQAREVRIRENEDYQRMARGDRREDRRQNNRGRGVTGREDRGRRAEPVDPRRGPMYGHGPGVENMAAPSVGYSTRRTRGDDHELGHGGFIGGGYRPDEAGRTGRGPKNYQRADDRIREDLCERLMRGWIDAENVDVRVENGEITLVGTVRTRDEKRAIEELAEQVLGVKEVHNHLRLERTGVRQDPDMRRPVQPTEDARHTRDAGSDQGANDAGRALDS